jgi:predicted AlkP superfamily phosphohydrolase/phosphomutase
VARRSALALLVLAGCGDAGEQRRVIVLGFDGMDYALTRKMMAEGRLPNLARLASSGTFRPLGTSMPPQSPVAWSNFITGMDSGGHGIFDFIHRDAKTMTPYLSTSRTEPSPKLKLGGLMLPLWADRIELLRHGKPFWEALEERGVRTTIVRIPANFPPSGSASRELSGMGTPDVLGSYGTFSYYTSDPSPWAEKEPSGGKVYAVRVADGVVRGTLHGPRNPFRVEAQDATTEFQVYVDPDALAAKLVVGDEERVLKAGEWSDWVPIRLDLLPTQTVRAIARFYLRRVRPDFGLYVTPLDLDPMDPAMPISTPGSFAADLARSTGRFYTQGMPEDTKAYQAGVFSTEEFLAQARLAGEEVFRQYRHMLPRFTGGLLFYYFGNGDQVSHMMWRAMDPGHPAWRPSDARWADVVPRLYQEFDRIVGETFAAMTPTTTLVVMSDHGFVSWRRVFHLNAWLRDHGYLALRDPARHADPGFFGNVDWSRTRAYGLGLNGLYVSLAGRERQGIVSPAEREQLIGEISAKLLSTTDPKTGRPAVTKAFRREQYRDRGHLEVGPDLIVGYAGGTRGSNESALGAIAEDVFADNTEPWSGDHCMDPDAVPGVLFTSRALKKPVARLDELAGAILAEFGTEIATFPAGN